MDRARVAVLRELIHHRTAGISQREQARDFVICLAGCVVARAAQAFVGKMRRAILRFRFHGINHGVPAGNNQARSGQFGRVLPSRMRFQKYRVNVAFEMVHADQRLPQCLRQNFAIRDAYQQRSHQARTARDSHRMQSPQRDSGLFQRFAYYRHDLAQMLARGKLRHNAAIFAVNRDLRCDDAGKNGIAVGNDRGGSLIARRFNPENDFA